MSSAENNTLTYDIELDGNSMRCGQPSKIKKILKPHQLACLYKAIYMENIGTITYKNRDVSLRNNNPRTIKISTNIGIIGDIVGYGKTLTALSIIAHNSLDKIHINSTKVHSFHSNKAYNYFTAETDNLSLPNQDNMINSTLIIVPRGPVYVQWEKTLKDATDLKYIAIEDLNFIKKNLPPFTNNERDIIDYFNQFDVVLIKNTTLDRLLDYYNYPAAIKHFIYKWKRIMIDECHDIINKIEIFDYLFIWLISGTYFNMCNRISSPSYSQYYNIKDILREDYINYILVKCDKDFVKESFKIPPIIEYYHLCKMSKYLKIIKKYINSSILDKINANDISGAIKDLGGKNETEEGIATLICADMNKNLSNKQKEREYISGLDILEENKANRLKTIDNEITIIEGKIKDLTERITEINSKICSICLDNVSQPIILECTHIFCGSCLFKFLNSPHSNSHASHASHNAINKRCPDCRAEIRSTENLTAIVSIKNEITNEIASPVCEGMSKIGKGILNKEDTLLEIIKNKPDGKFIVFSRVDVFTNIIKLLVSNGITFAELKGNTSHMMNVLKDFKNGVINVILLTTQYAGYGIDINYATDVIIFHSMAVDKQQAIGRAQRVGRTNNLVVHNLCFEHELEDNIQSPAI
uniref:RING-type domain-containing protein n=1 Tax=viral metagenome TaxID=1070528 RepID=A0A6C0CCM7_9ZZZZ